MRVFLPSSELGGVYEAQVLTNDNLILIALLSEWTQTTSNYIHAWDNSGRDKSGKAVRNVVSQIAYVSRAVRVLKKDRLQPQPQHGFIVGFVELLVLRGAHTAV